MHFQDVPDSNSMALADLNAAFPRLKWTQGTTQLLRDRMKTYSEDVVKRAVLDLIESGKESASSLERSPVAAMIVALKRASEYAPARTGMKSSLADAERRFHELTPRERKMVTHAKDVLWAADIQRRMGMQHPKLKHLDVDAEMRAHGVSISNNGDRVFYAPQFILNPEDECRFLELTQAGLV